MTSFWWLTVNCLAVFRLTRLISIDTIMERPRKRLLDTATRIAFEDATSNHNRPTPITTNVFGKAWEMITCPWCLSVWLAVPVVAFTKLIPGVWLYPALALALTAVTGLLSELI
jgi:Protein of unknown function (DUF1360)